MDREQRLQQYNDIYETIHHDDELMLRVLVETFGSVDSLWEAVHTHVTSLNEPKHLDDEEVEYQVENVVYAFREIMDKVVEEELLDDGEFIHTITVEDIDE